LKNDSDEPFSKTLFDHIERTLYYIETQLTHVDDQLKARYNSYNSKNKLVLYCIFTSQFRYFDCFIILGNLKYHVWKLYINHW